MDEIIVERVRCFQSRQSVRLRPITLLVGENSTGKSSFLALTRVAWDLLTCRRAIDFNEEPFTMGSYDEIATYRGGRAGRARSFTIGSSTPVTAFLREQTSHELGESVAVTSSFSRDEAQPTLRRWSVVVGPFRVMVKWPDQGLPVLDIRTPSAGATLHDIPFGQQWPGALGPLDYIRYVLRAKDNGEGSAGTKLIPDADIGLLSEITDEISLVAGYRPYAFAPIRTQPQRTYDVLKDMPSPEGSHVPMILAKMASSAPGAWKTLREQLKLFGEASGLFDDVDVKRKGQKSSDPFQVRVRISGPARNVVDVGYGVSQVLPLIVDSIEGKNGSTFLLQQPEVHLHPKAQAELGSFLAFIAKSQEKRFLIETHSDHLIDRVRMDLRDREYLAPEDVSLLYFERDNGEVTIHQLDLDECGNIVNAPPGYRQFFLQEEARLLGV